MIKIIDGQLHIIDDRNYFYAVDDYCLSDLQYALYLSINALSEERYYNTEAVKTLTDFLTILLPTKEQGVAMVEAS